MVNSIVSESREEISVGTIGKLLIDNNRLNTEQALKVLSYQKEKDMRFGEAAIELGFIKSEDIDFALSQQFSYSYLKPGDGVVSDEIIAAYYPFSDYAEKLRTLRSELHQKWFKSGRKSLLIASADEYSNSAVLSANLAVVLAQRGERVLLIDADLRQSKIHNYFNLINKHGLSDVLANRSTLESIQKISQLSNLSILTAGTDVPNPQELLSKLEFKLLIEDLEQRFDSIIVNSPQLGQCVDTQVISTVVSGLLFVAKKDISRIADLQIAIKQINNASATVLGCVLEGK